MTFSTGGKSEWYSAGFSGFRIYVKYLGPDLSDLLSLIVDNCLFSLKICNTQILGMVQDIRASMAMRAIRLLAL